MSRKRKVKCPKCGCPDVQCETCGTIMPHDTEREWCPKCFKGKDYPYAEDNGVLSCMGDGCKLVVSSEDDGEVVLGFLSGDQRIFHYDGRVT